MHFIGVSSEILPCEKYSTVIDLAENYFDVGEEIPDKLLKLYYPEVFKKVEKEKQQIREASDALLTAAPELEKGVLAVIARVPDSVREKVKPLADRIPKTEVEAKGKQAAERVQSVLGVLNELNKSNLEIASLLEIHDIGNGKKAEVKTIYVGLGQGYFVNAAGDIAGIGTPGTDGWVWKTDPSIAKKMIEVLDVMKKTISPKLVELPATLD